MTNNEIYTAVTVAVLVAFYAALLPTAWRKLKSNFSLLPKEYKLKYGVLAAASTVGCWAVFIGICIWSPLTGMIMTLSGVVWFAAAMYNKVIKRSMASR